MSRWGDLTVVIILFNFLLFSLSSLGLAQLDVTKNEIRFAVVSPFNNMTGDKRYDFLETVLPASIITQFSQAKTQISEGKIQNVSFIKVSPEQAEREDIDAQITGAYSREENNIIVFVNIEEQAGPTFHVEVRSPTDEIRRVPETLFGRILEIIKGRVTSEGEWKAEPILFREAEAVEYFDQGEGYFQAKDYDSAILMYRKALEKKPDVLDTHLRLGDVYRAQEKYETAIAEYQSSLQRDDRVASAHYGLGMVYSKKREYDNAISEFKSALRFASDDRIRFEAYKGLGDLYFAQEQYDDAIENYREAETVDNNHPEIHLSLGRAYLAENNLDEATQYATEALQDLEAGWVLLPDEPEFKENLARIYNALGITLYTSQEYGAALTAFEKTIELTPEDNQLQAEAYRYAGIILVDKLQHNVKQGIEYLEKTISLDANNELSYRTLGIAYREDRQYDKAIKKLKRAIDIEPTYETYVEIGETYGRMRKYDLAAENLNLAIALYPKRPQAYNVKDKMDRLKNIPAASLVVPGLGQHLQGRHGRAWFYEGLTIGAIAAVLWANSRYQQTLDDYQDVQDTLTQLAPTQPELTSELNELLDKQAKANDEAQSIRKQAITMQIALAAVWGVNAVDAGVLDSAVATSLVVPGLGQHLQGRHGRAWLYEGLIIGAGAAALWANSRHQQTLEDYQNIQATLTVLAPTQTELTSELGKLLEKQAKANDEAKSARTLAIATQIALGVVWGINVLDATLVKPARRRRGIALEAHPTVDGGRVLVRVQF